MTGFVLPTQWTSEQEKIARRQKLAEAMIEANLGEGKGYTSALQVLGQLAGAFAGKRMEGKADKAESDLNQQIMSQYATELGSLNKDANSGVDPAKIVQTYQMHPELKDALEPYAKAMATRLSNQEEIKSLPDGTFGRAGDYLGPNARPVPNNPDAMVLRGPNGTMRANDVKVTADLAAQGLGTQGGPTMAPIPIPSPAPPLPTSPQNIQAASPGQTQPGQVGAPTLPTPVAAQQPRPMTATGPGGQKIMFDPSSGRWVPMTQGGPTAYPSGGFP